ncbi:MAG: winged helix-turn-helix domain-containing protein [Candidatus Thermoplasmatota archaeon]|nr:winged helix-turn-helix domain-containing protein [Candidatus Thermoplasmatota archaeon]
MRVELNKKALFALASDTRLEILRAMQPMRRTVSQLAEALGIDKAAVYRHLQKLTEGELVKRYDDHGFVYYGLSWKTRDILNPNDNTKIVILLASSIVLFMVAVAAVFAGLSSTLGEPALGDFPLSGEGGFRDQSTGTLGDAPGPAEEDSQPGVLMNTVWMILALVAPVAAIPLLYMSWRGMRRPKQREASPFSSGGAE